MALNAAVVEVKWSGWRGVDINMVLDEGVWSTWHRRGGGRDAALDKGAPVDVVLIDMVPVDARVVNVAVVDVVSSTWCCSKRGLSKSIR